MQKRRASRLSVVGERTERPRVVRLSADPARPTALRKREGYICRDGVMPNGFAWQVLIGDGLDKSSLSVPDGSAVVCLPSSFDHLTDGDVVRRTGNQAVQLNFLA